MRKNTDFVNSHNRDIKYTGKHVWKFVEFIGRKWQNWYCERIGKWEKQTEKTTLKQKLMCYETITGMELLNK